MSRSFATEAELAALVVAWLQEEQWEVYQEVNTGQGAPTCDIVATRGKVTWAIECKLSLNLDVIAQAMHWRHRAHYSSVAVPAGRTARKAEAILAILSLGIITGTESGARIYSVAPFTRPRIDLRRFLDDAQKTGVKAGTNRGGYWSPFKRTCQAVREAVGRRDGITLKELLSEIAHHYGSDSTAKSCIANWAEAGKIPGVRLVRDGRRIRLHAA